MEKGITLSVCTSVMSRAEHNGLKCAREGLGVRRNVSGGEGGDSPPCYGFSLCGGMAMETCGTLVQLNRSVLAMLSEVKCRHTTRV